MSRNTLIIQDNGHSTIIPHFPYPTTRMSLKSTSKESLPLYAGSESFNMFLCGNAALYWAFPNPPGTLSQCRGSLLKNPFGDGFAMPLDLPDYAAPEKAFMFAVDCQRAGNFVAEGQIWKSPSMHILKTAKEAVEALDHLTARAQNGVPITVDIETVLMQHISTIGFCYNTEESFCLPFLIETYPYTQIFSNTEELEIGKALFRLMRTANGLWQGQNLHYDFQFFHRWFGHMPDFLNDSMILQHLLLPGTPKDLGHLSSMYCKQHAYWKGERKSTSQEEKWLYNCKDVLATHEVIETQIGNLTTDSLVEKYRFYKNIQAKVNKLCILGNTMDLKKHGEFLRQLNKDIEIGQALFESIVGQPININSSKQLQDLFFKILKYPVRNKRATGKPSMDDESLEKLAGEDPLTNALCLIIRDLRKFKKFASSFLEANFLPNGKLGTSYNPCGTLTSRLSSSKNAFGEGLNMQTIPKEQKSASGIVMPNIKTLFIPDSGYVYFDLDLTQADLFVVVWEANDLVLKHSLRLGTDTHLYSAMSILGEIITPEQCVPSAPGYPALLTKWKGERFEMKKLIHGTNYGAGPQVISEQTSFSFSEVKKFQEKWFLLHPAIKKRIEKIRGLMNTTRVLTNVFGFRIKFLGHQSLPQALAWSPQSTVAILINKIWIAADNIEGLEIMNQTHDSLSGQIQADRQDLVLTELKEAARITLPFSDPLIIPSNIKTSPISWGDCE